MVGRVGGYDVRIEEVHHTQKKDAPSGTAITLAEEIIGRIGTKERWVNRPAADPSELAIGIDPRRGRCRVSTPSPTPRRTTC